MLQRLRQAETGQGQRVHNPPPGWSSTLVKRLHLERKLEGHDGCVNTVHFSPDGQLLVSGSDDMSVVFWDWQLGTRTLAFHSGHHNNVFQARIMPQSANSTVVTCAADGLVRVATIPQGCGGAAVETRRLACHRGRAHKLSLEPGSPHCFLSCGEDGEVRHFDLRQPPDTNRRLLACRTQRGRLELNSVHCHSSSTQFCVAGGDPFVRIYDLRRVAPSSDPVAEPMRRLAPWHLRGRSSSITITCAVFSQRGQVLASYNDENIHLFTAEQQQATAAANGAASTSGSHTPRTSLRAAAGPAAGAERYVDAGRTGGSSSSRQGNKRGRNSGGANADGASGSGGEDAEGEHAAAEARVRSQQRRAAAAAALVQAQTARGAATAAAEAHASIRQGLLYEDEGEGEGDPLLPPVMADAAASGSGIVGTTSDGREPDAAWLHQLPATRRVPRIGGSSGQQEQQQQQQEYEVQQMRGRGQEIATVPPGSSQRMIAGNGADTSSSVEQGDSGDSPSDSGSSSGEEGEGEEAQGIEVELVGSEEEEEGELPQGPLVDDSDVVPRNQLCGAARSGNGQEGQPSDGVLQTYKGHRNYRTVKGVSFLGRDDEFVMSGSDCGHVFVWDVRMGMVQAMLKGDADTVNCLEPHPHHLLTIATSGIEDNIKLWAPTAERPQVLGAAEERRMAANQRAQGEERRMLFSPEMLALLLRTRQLDDSEGDEEEEEEDDGEGSGRRRRHGECIIS